MKQDDFEQEYSSLIKLWGGNQDTTECFQIAVEKLKKRFKESKDKKEKSATKKSIFQERIIIHVALEVRRDLIKDELIENGVRLNEKGWKLLVDEVQLNMPKEMIKDKRTIVRVLTEMRSMIECIGSNQEEKDENVHLRPCVDSPMKMAQSDDQHKVPNARVKT